MVLEVPGPLVLVGAGKMGGALLERWLERGIDPAQVFIKDPAPSASVVELIGRHRIARTPPGPLAAPSVIVFAVKPQIMDDVLAALACHVAPTTLVLSIAAGRTIASLAKHLPAHSAVVRAMPNTPAAVGRGITVCIANDAVTNVQRGLADALLAAVGEVVWVEHESLMDAVTAVSGSGPAYVFLLAECLVEAGQTQGLDRALAERLARATIAGAGELLIRSDVDLKALREAVTSPGGTTAAALEVLMGERGLRATMIEAVAAAARRSRELAK